MPRFFVPKNLKANLFLPKRSAHVSSSEHDNAFSQAMLALVKGEQTTDDPLLAHFVESFKQAQAQLDVAQKGLTQAETQLAQKRNEGLKIQGQVEFIATQMRQAWDRVQSQRTQNEVSPSAA
jgi:phage shock protein A